MTATPGSHMSLVSQVFHVPKWRRRSDFRYHAKLPSDVFRPRVSWNRNYHGWSMALPGDSRLWNIGACAGQSGCHRPVCDDMTKRVRGGAGNH